jgi:4-diphosphocytidyl-2-C-methyl-D-erythritol kinase
VTEPLWGEDERPRPAALGPVKVRVPAKINLHLGVGPLRADGFHELATIYHAISIYDEITARAADSLALTMDGEGAGQLALDDTNLVIRAVRALAAATGREPHARLHLRKQIPIAAGLAGGSADAAATLVACDALWGTGLSREQLAHIGAELGSDVPFLVFGGTALGTGRGEAVTPVLATGHAWHWVVATAEGGLSTPAVYRRLDDLRQAGLAPPPIGVPEDILAALRQRDPHVLAKVLANDMQPASLALRPALGRTLESGLAAGALAGMVSGSGPTCVFLARDAAHADGVARALDERGECRGVRVAHGPVAGARLV